MDTIRRKQIDEVLNSDNYFNKIVQDLLSCSSSYVVLYYDIHSNEGTSSVILSRKCITGI